VFLLYKDFSRKNNPPEKSVVGATPSVPSDFLPARMLKTHSFSAQFLVFRHKLDWACIQSVQIPYGLSVCRNVH